MVINISICKCGFVNPQIWHVGMVYALMDLVEADVVKAGVRIRLISSQFVPQFGFHS